MSFAGISINTHKKYRIARLTEKYFYIISKCKYNVKGAYKLTNLYTVTNCLQIPTTNVKTLAAIMVLSQRNLVLTCILLLPLFSKNRQSILFWYNPKVVHQLCSICLSPSFSQFIFKLVVWYAKFFSPETAERNY